MSDLRTVEFRHHFDEAFLVKFVIGPMVGLDVVVVAAVDVNVFWRGVD